MHEVLVPLWRETPYFKWKAVPVSPQNSYPGAFISETRPFNAQKLLIYEFRLNICGGVCCCFVWLVYFFGGWVSCAQVR